MTMRNVDRAAYARQRARAEFPAYDVSVTLNHPEGQHESWYIAVTFPDGTVQSATGWDFDEVIARLRKNVQQATTTP